MNHGSRCWTHLIKDNDALVVVDRKDSRVSSKFIIFCFFKMKNRSQACFMVITGGGWWWLVVLDLEGGSCKLV